jgi:uncharacterized membrane protein
MQNPPPVQMSNPTPVAVAKSSTGLDENIAALLSYVLGWITGLIFMLLEKESRLVRFHAVQALILGIIGLVFSFGSWIVWLVIAIIASMLPDVLGMLVMAVVGLVMLVIVLAIVVGWVIGMVKAYQGQYFKLPLIGNFAEKFSQK